LYLKQLFTTVLWSSRKTETTVWNRKGSMSAHRCSVMLSNTNKIKKETKIF